MPLRTPFLTEHLQWLLLKFLVYERILFILSFLSKITIEQICLHYHQIFSFGTKLTDVLCDLSSDKAGDLSLINVAALIFLKQKLYMGRF